MCHSCKFGNKAKCCLITKFGILHKELAIACHINENGQLRYQFTLGLL